MRRLKPDPVPDAVLHRVLEAGTCAANGGNMQSWRFLVIRDPAIKAAAGAQEPPKGATETVEAINADFDKGGGIVPVVGQDHGSREVLMMGYANRAAVELTLATGKLHFWSRSRNELWLKGKNSRNYLLVRRLNVDCDGDTLLAEVQPATGATPVCHTGAETCFFTELPVEE